MLHAWEDLAPAEIATVLGVRPNAISVRLHRARRRFAAALDGHDRTPTEELEARR
jgi:RNA polymerase sigma-70 factor (ECF subfamily)